MKVSLIYKSGLGSLRKYKKRGRAEEGREVRKARDDPERGAEHETCCEVVRQGGEWKGPHCGLMEQCSAGYEQRADQC